MSKQDKSAQAPTLEELSRQFDSWRKTKRHRGTPIPQELWDAAAQLAERHGVYRVARALRLDYNGFKRRVEQAGKAPGPKVKALPESAVGFIELEAIGFPSQTSPMAETLLELSAADGARLRLHLRGTPGVDLVALTCAFWRR